MKDNRQMMKIREEKEEKKLNIELAKYGDG